MCACASRSGSALTTVGRHSRTTITGASQQHRECEGTAVNYEIILSFSLSLSLSLSLPARLVAMHLRPTAVRRKLQIKEVEVSNSKPTKIDKLAAQSARAFATPKCGPFQLRARGCVQVDRSSLRCKVHRQVSDDFLQYGLASCGSIAGAGRHDSLIRDETLERHAAEEPGRRFLRSRSCCAVSAVATAAAAAAAAAAVVRR